MVLATMSCATVLLYFLRMRDEQKPVRKVIQYLSEAFIFAISWIMLTDLFILILERFFRYEEHLTFAELGSLWLSSYDRLLWGMLLSGFYRFLGVVLIEHGEMRYHHQHQKELEKELSAMKLVSLRRELNPHFLHNAMNSIAMMVRIQKYDRAIEMIANLNDFLRAALSRDTKLLIPLTDELHLLDQYLKIEMTRFGDRVRVEKDIDEATCNVLVPQLILQPIVENVFKHGMQYSVGPQALLIRSMRQKEYVILSIMNTSSPIKNSLYDSNQQSIGLKNTTDRLRYLYGSDFKFQLLELSEGYNVRITIPAHA